MDNTTDKGQESADRAATVQDSIRRQRFRQFHPRVGDLMGAEVIQSTPHLHALHASISAYRTFWSVLETLRQIFVADYSVDLDDRVVDFIGMLASDPAELITHEHVASLIALLDTPPPSPTSSTS